VSYKRIKAEHSGSTNDDGTWLTRTKMKQSTGRKRRRADKAVEDGRLLNAWNNNLEQFGTYASRGVLRHMTEDEERAGLSWEEFRPGVKDRKD